MKPYLISALAAILSSSAMAYDVKSGGKTSVKKDGANAYSLPAANLPMSKRLDFSVGNSFSVILGCKHQRRQMLVMA